MVRTVTAVGALDAATDRSSQLGQRITDSMAAARWALVGGDEENTPLPISSATTSTTPSNVHSGKCRLFTVPKPWPWRSARRGRRR